MAYVFYCAFLISHLEYATFAILVQVQQLLIGGMNILVFQRKITLLNNLFLLLVWLLFPLYEFSLPKSVLNLTSYVDLQ